MKVLGARPPSTSGVRNGPVDIVMLSHDRLDYLKATVDALQQRTPEPFRLTIVDNASGHEVRNWLAANRHRFERIILRPQNEHVPAFQHGIEATLSDPFIVTDPDIVVPEVEPSWLARLLDLIDRHPDFGLIAMGLDQANRPPVLDAEAIDPEQVVDGEIVESGVGTVFQAIRRDALVVAYRSDGETCTAIRRAGWRVGWALGLRAVHLGWDDFRVHPGHLASKGTDYGVVYREVGLLRRPPTLEQIAQAAPALAATRRLGVPDSAVVELSWSGPLVGAACAAALTIDPPSARVPLDDGAAGAVVLVDPPADRAPELVAEAARVATSAVVALAPLAALGGSAAVDLAPSGWAGQELPGPNDILTRMAAAADADPSLARELGSSLLDDVERWQGVFAAGAFLSGTRRLFVWERAGGLQPPRHVRYDPARLIPWAPAPITAPSESKSRLRLMRERLGLRARTRVIAGLLRKRFTALRLGR
jgi:Glycosyl transferase family 2